MKPRVLLLSATTGYQLRSFADAADRVGVDLVYATDRCHQLDDPWRDRAIAVRFHEEGRSLDLIAAEARRAPFQAVLAVGDRPTVLAARAAERLGLPGNSPDGAAASGNKRETRVRCAAAGLRVPWHVIVPIATPGTDVARDPRVNFPCVVKPLGLSGSRGVIRADTPEALARAVDRVRALLERPDVRAARTGLEDSLLVEGFIPGHEYAVEGVLTSGSLQVFAIFDKPDPLDGPFFEETIYVTPPLLEASARDAIGATIARAAAAIGLSHGPIHAELRVDPSGPAVLEIAPRPIGGLCSKVVRFADGASLEDVLLRHALGEDVSGVCRESSAAAVMMIPIPRRGVLKRVDGEADARALEGIEDVRITAKSGQLLEPLPEAGSYLGFIFARGSTPRAAESAVREAHTRLSFTIDAPIDVITTA